MDGWLRRLLDEIRSGLESLYDGRLRGVYLFGSHARGEADSGSDVDVLVVLDEMRHYFGETERTSGLVSSLSLTYDVSLSFVFMSVAEWSQADSPFLLTVRRDVIAA